MGLDMYGGVTKRSPTRDVDFRPYKPQIIHQWRKHPNLHGWMESLYRVKGGKGVKTGLGEHQFNSGATVRLNLTDLDNLEQAVTGKALPPTSGFFFGESDGTEAADDLEFIAKARTAIADGLIVLYESWW